MAENWFKRAINWIWYENLSKQYNPQLHIENSIKDAKTQKYDTDTGKYTSQPEMARAETVTQKDVVEYFIKDGLSEAGNANVFISMKGPRGDLNLGFDSTAITNPQFMNTFDVASNKAADALGKKHMCGKAGVKAGVSYEAGYTIGPKLTASLGLGYGRLTGDFVLTARLPLNMSFLEEAVNMVDKPIEPEELAQRRNAFSFKPGEFETLDINSLHMPVSELPSRAMMERRNAIGAEPKEEIFPLAYYEMRGINTEKEISGAVALSLEASVKAKASAGAGASSGQKVTATVTAADVNVNSLMNAKAGAKN